MFRFDAIDLQRIAVSSVGALLLSTACVVAAVSPAHAGTPNAPATIGDWQQVVEQQIDANLQMPLNGLGYRSSAVATITIRFDANGDVAAVGIGRSAGSKALDAEALRTAKSIAYPALPQGLRGRPQTVAMQIYFGRSDTAVAAARRNENRALAKREKNDVQTAALPTG